MSSTHRNFVFSDFDSLRRQWKLLIGCLCPLNNQVDTSCNSSKTEGVAGKCSSDGCINSWTWLTLKTHSCSVLNNSQKTSELLSFLCWGSFPPCLLIFLLCVFMCACDYLYDCWKSTRVSFTAELQRNGAI